MRIEKNEFYRIKITKERALKLMKTLSFHLLYLISVQLSLVIYPTPHLYSPSSPLPLILELIN